MFANPESLQNPIIFWRIQRDTSWNVETLFYVLIKYCSKPKSMLHVIQPVANLSRKMHDYCLYQIVWAGGFQVVLENPSYRIPKCQLHTFNNNIVQVFNWNTVCKFYIKIFLSFLV